MTTARNKQFTDRELAEAYIRKSRAGEDWSTREKNAFDRVQASQENRIWDKLSTELSKARYERLSGRTTTQLHRAEKLYGIPVTGKVINLSEVAAWTHDFLASGRVLAGDDLDPMLGGGNSPALEKCRHEKWLLLTLERQAREGSLIPLDLLASCHNQMASILKRCGETLQRTHGPEAADVLRTALKSVMVASDEIISKSLPDADKPKPKVTDGPKRTKTKKKQPKTN